MPSNPDQRMADAMTMFSAACTTLGLSDAEAIIAAAQFTGLAAAKLPSAGGQHAALHVAAEAMLGAYRGKVSKGGPRR